MTLAVGTIMIVEFWAMFSGFFLSLFFTAFTILNRPYNKYNIIAGVTALFFGLIAYGGVKILTPHWPIIHALLVALD